MLIYVLVINTAAYIHLNNFDARFFNISNGLCVRKLIGYEHIYGF